MKLKIIILMSLLSLQAQAVKFATKPAAESSKGRKVATESESSVNVLVKIKQCVDVGQNPSGIRACAKDILASSLDSESQDRLLMWFRYPYELSAPSPCDPASLKFMPEDKMKNVTEVVCSNYSNGVALRRVMFFMVDEKSQRKLSNIKDDFVSEK